MMQAAEHLEASLELAWQTDQRAEVQSELRGVRDVLAQLGPMLGPGLVQ